MSHKKNAPCVSAIIPAYNEESTIADVVRVARTHPQVKEVIVVSDGSTDRTVQRARRAGARVIELRENHGKGHALSVGVAATSSPLILFLDADLLGLTHAMISRLISAIRSGRYDMYTLVRDRASEKFQLRSPTWIVGGERILRRALWDLVPEQDRTGFQVELALNYYAKKHGFMAGCELAPGLEQVIKEKKHGFVKGFWLRACEWTQCLVIYLRLHVFRVERG